VLEAIRSLGSFDVAGLVDDDPGQAGSALLGFPVLGPEALESLREDGVAHAFTGVGGIGDSSGRRRVFERLQAAGFELPPILHASAVVSPWARVGPGTHILATAVVNAGADVAENVIVNTGAIIEHDCRVASDVHIGPGACLAGLVTIGESAHVGIGAVVIEGVSIGEGAFVAAGAVVVGDVPDGVRVAGVPARPLP
jgi:UDP-perosamine 4-acetyltransferase